MIVVLGILLLISFIFCIEVMLVLLIVLSIFLFYSMFGAFIRKLFGNNLFNIFFRYVKVYKVLSNVCLYASIFYNNFKKKYLYMIISSKENSIDFFKNNSSLSTEIKEFKYKMEIRYTYINIVLKDFKIDGKLVGDIKVQIRLRRVLFKECERGK